jgi:hypothetical protein
MPEEPDVQLVDIDKLYDDMAPLVDSLEAAIDFCLSNKKLPKDT